jgi:hypothetical protein
VCCSRKFQRGVFVFSEVRQEEESISGVDGERAKRIYANAVARQHEAADPLIALTGSSLPTGIEGWARAWAYAKVTRRAAMGLLKELARQLQRVVTSTQVLSPYE